MSEKWDIRFLKLCEHIAQWSKDPSTKVGSVIVKNKRIISMGYNGFPQKVNDDIERYNNREIKYKLIHHAEINAILFANQNLKNSTLYVYPLFPCVRCACTIIQSGIKRVVSIEASNKIKERWKEDIELSKKIFSEADVEYQIYNFEKILEK